MLCTKMLKIQTNRVKEPHYSQSIVKNHNQYYYYYLYSLRVETRGRLQFLHIYLFLHIGVLAPPFTFASSSSSVLLFHDIIQSISKQYIHTYACTMSMKRIDTGDTGEIGKGGGGGLN